jgi:uncharacterized protein YndB with AHSA1/START domain
VSKNKTAASPKAPKRQVTIERTYQAALEEVWDLWTTKEGLESWWGPEGFEVKVRKLDLRPGGELQYAMSAIAPEQIEFMKKAGMALTSEIRGTYTEVIPRRRLAFLQLADFIPGVAPYDTGTIVEFHPSAQGVRVVLTIEAMHDDHWTQMAVMGWESELGKLAKLLER